MNDTINIIESSTEERNKKTKELFNKIKPLLDEGHIYSTAIFKVTGKQSFNRFQYAWCRDLLEYGEKQGYRYEDYSGKKNSIKYKKKGV